MDAEIQHLTARMVAGDESAYRAFHDRFYSVLFRYLVVVTRGDEQAALDAVQETCLRVVKHIRRFDTEAAFQSWLLVLARSAARDGGRRRQSYLKLLARYAQSLWTSRRDSAQETVPLPGLETPMAEVLSQLDEPDRSLVEGKYLEGQSVRKLAETFGLTEKAVESRLLRARRTLKQKLLKVIHENARSEHE